MEPIIPIRSLPKETDRLKVLRIKDENKIKFLNKENGDTILLGEGAYGSVRKGEYNGCPVAIKTINCKIDENEDDKELENLIRECNIMADFTSPNIIKLFGYTFTETVRGSMKEIQCKIVMELAEKNSLHKVIMEEKSNFSWEKRIKIAKGAAKGLSLLHMHNVIHRDLKPKNILIFEEYEAKLCDFGIAKKRGTANTNAASKTIVNNMGIGTLGWMAPELFNSNPQYSRESDIYAFGVVLWQLAALKGPSTKKIENSKEFEDWVNGIKNGRREEIPVDCPKDFDVLIRKCWAASPSERPKISEVLENLEKIEQYLKDSAIAKQNFEKVDKEEEVEETKLDDKKIPNDITVPIQKKNVEEKHQELKTEFEVADEESLILSTNDVSDDKLLLMERNESFRETFFALLDRDSEVIEINSSIIKNKNNLFDEEGILLICKHINFTKNLKRLVLEFGECENFNETCVFLISEALIGLKNLNYLSLELRGEVLNEKSLEDLFDKIRKLKRIGYLELNLSFADIGSQTMITLSNTIGELNNFKTLKLNIYSCKKNMQEGIDFFFSNIYFLKNCTCLELFMGALTPSPSEETLMLMGRNLKSLEGLEILVLGLQKWDISDEGFLEFGEIIKECRSLKTLKISIWQSQITQTTRDAFKTNASATVTYIAN